ncbi:MAG: peptidase inhibitor family I36 protein [Acidobacteria bacterium]|nr:peptidase inhibitor family I36 protein [Acidobacteriota bacterium]
MNEVHAQERAMGGEGITVFEDRDFRGKSATYTRDVANLADSGLNDRISSLKVGPGELWEICEHANYQGRCVVVSGEERDLRQNSWNDMISSMRRRSGGGGTPVNNPYIVLYSQPNYRGTPTNINGPSPSLNRTAQSVTVGRGVWELCDGVNYTGRCVRVDKSMANLAGLNMRRRVASARPVGSTTPERPDDGYIVVFSQTNYRGTSTNYSSTQRNIRRTVGSITIGRGVWEVCTGANFGGRCEILNQSVSNFSSLGIGRQIRSIRPARPQPR